jgi:hypothetical protein
MRRSRSRSLMVAFFALSAILMLQSPARGEGDPKPSRDPKVFKEQLVQFKVLGRRTLQEIQALPVDDSVPVNPQVHYHAKQAYVLIRAAQWGMAVAIQRQTVEDPILVLAQKRAEAAWHLARFPVDNTGMARPEYISRSVRDLSQALKLVDQALTVLP